MNKLVLRQGDVMVRRIPRRDLSDAKAIAREGGRVVLAHGEVTGHAHAIRSPRADLFEAAGRFFLTIDGETVALEHEEHSTIEIPPGHYEVIRQREYSPEAIRNVAD